MKRSSLAPILLVALVLIALPEISAKANGGAIMVLKNEDCLVWDDGPKLHTLTVVHKYNTGFRASRFKIQVDQGIMLDYVSETHALPLTYGDFRTGIMICYGTCTVGDVLLGTITFAGYGTSAQCGGIRVVPYPASETLDVTRCNFELEKATTYILEVATPARICGLCSPHMDAIDYPGTPQAIECAPLPVSTSTWGEVKALYR